MRARTGKFAICMAVCWLIIAPLALASDFLDTPARMAPLADQSLILDFAASNDRAIAVGDRGHILVSESRSDWRQVESPTSIMLTAVSAAGNHAWAVGHDHAILHSPDGGLTWEMQHSFKGSDGPLLDVLFLDENQGIAIGAYGAYLATDDGGATWTDGFISERTVKSAAVEDDAGDTEDWASDGLASTDMGDEMGDPHLNAIAATPEGLLIVAEAGAAFRSTNRGESWTRLEMPYAGSMFGAVALDDGSIITFGLRGNVFRTTDLGQTWESMDSGTNASLFGGVALSGGRAVMVGAGGAVVLAPAGSRTLRLLDFPDGGVMSSVLAVSDVQFVVGGENGIDTYSPN